MVTMREEKMMYKYIYKRTVRKASGTYYYYNVILGRSIKQRYVGCSRKLAECEKILVRYAKDNNININEFLK
jgi:hypothetical protein